LYAVERYLIAAERRAAAPLLLSAGVCCTRAMLQMRRATID